MSKTLPGLRRRAPGAPAPGPAVPQSESPPVKPRVAEPKPRNRAKPKPATAQAAAPPHADEKAARRLSEAKAIVARHETMALAGGLVPLPWVDAAVVMGIQVRMLAALCRLYGVPFESQRARALISALVGGLAPFSMGAGIGGSVMKSTPGIGMVLGLGVVALGSRWATRIIGQIFIQHFETGCTLLDFEPESMRAHFEAAR